MTDSHERVQLLPSTPLLMVEVVAGTRPTGFECAERLGVSRTYRARR